MPVSSFYSSVIQQTNQKPWEEEKTSLKSNLF